jgi:hypothetical protein
MAESDIIQIRIGGHLIGIIGLKKVMTEMAGEFAAKSDEGIRAELFRVMGVPALVVNGRVVSVGSVPTKGEIRQWLQEAAGFPG